LGFEIDCPVQSLELKVFSHLPVMIQQNNAAADDLIE
jgi:hypothetical protein